MLLHKLFMDTKKLLPRVGANPGFGDVGAEFMVSAERSSAYIGYLGASPPVVSSGKAPGGARSLKLTNYQQMIH